MKRLFSASSRAGDMKKSPAHFNSWFKTNYLSLSIIDKVELLEDVSPITRTWEIFEDK
jgi:hypothetical protein